MVYESRRFSQSGHVSERHSVYPRWKCTWTSLVNVNIGDFASRYEPGTVSAQLTFEYQHIKA